MVALNPAPNDLDPPSYLKLSQPITQPEADKSTGTLLSGLGDLFSTGVKAAESFTEKLADNALKPLDGLRDRYIDQLDGVKTLIGAKTAAENADAGAGQSATDAMAAVPKQLIDSLQGIGDMIRGKENGRISESYFKQNAYDIIKGVRADFPGHREYIDKKVSEMGFGNPANELKQSLISDINSLTTDAKAEREKNITMLREIFRESGTADSRRALLDYMAGKTTFEAATDKVSPQLKKLYDLKVNKAVYEDATEEEKSKKRAATDSAKRITDSVVNDYWGHVFDGVEHDPVTGQRLSTADIYKKLQDMVASGNIDPNLAQQMNTMNQMNKKASYDKMYAELQKQGITKILDATEINTMINAKLAKHDQISELIQHKEYGVAYDLFNQNRIIVDRASNKLLTDPSLEGWGAMIAAAHKEGGDRYFQGIIDRTLAGTYGADLGTRLKTIAGSMATRSDASGKPLPAGAPAPTLQQHVEKFIKDITASGGNPSADSKSVKFLTDIPNDITKPDSIVPPSMKKNIIEAVYGPGNEKLLSLFGKDYVDPATKKNIGGQATLFQRLYSQEITAEIKRQGDPKLWEMYRDSAERNYRMLFQSDVKDLETIQLSPYVGLGYSPIDHRFFLNPKQEVPIEVKRAGIRSLPGVDAAERTLNRINGGAQGLKNIYDAEGKDIDGAFIDYLQALGFDGAKGGTIPEQMWRNIVNSRTYQKPKGNKE